MSPKAVGLHNNTEDDEPADTVDAASHAVAGEHGRRAVRDPL